MKRMMLVLTLCLFTQCLLLNNAEARTGSIAHFVDHRYGGGVQFDFYGNGFYFGYGPGYGFQGFGYQRGWGRGRDYGYRGNGFYGGYRGAWNYGNPYGYMPFPYNENYYYGPRSYRYYGPPQYNHPYRGGRYWRY